MKKHLVNLLASLGLLTLLLIVAITVIIVSNQTSYVASIFFSSSHSAKNLQKSSFDNKQTEKPIILKVRLDRLPKDAYMPKQGEVVSLPFVLSKQIGVNQVRILEFSKGE